MALYRTPQEVTERYTEPWPADLVPEKHRDLSRPANFGNRGYPRAPYFQGDGKEDRILLAWGDGSCGRTGTGDLETYTTPHEVAYTRRIQPFVDCAGSRRHSLFCTGEGVILACGDGDDGQLGSKRLPPKPEGPEAKRERRRRIRRKLYGSDSSSDDPDAPPPLFTFSKTPEEAKEEALKIARKKQKREKRLKSASNLMTLKAKPMGVVSKKKEKGKSLEDWFTTGNRHLLRYPRQTFPSGNLSAAFKDIHTTQVACCATASFARETNADEALATKVALSRMTELVKRREAAFGYDDSTARLRASLVEEASSLIRTAHGRVLAWGTGVYGELGLGSRKQKAIPTQILSLNRRVHAIACGRAHVLALCAKPAALFVWGRGRDGRLGHGDYQDRDEPERLVFFDERKLAPRIVAAGDAHSLVVVDAAQGATAPEGVYAWGRGAHGRLGLGRTLNKKTPQHVETWPSCFRGMHVIGAALGGAHTLVLAERAVPASGANPWGRQRHVYAWGYGGNGQIGDETMTDRSLPTRVKLPRQEVVQQVACGKAHSLAVTVHGDLYAWGKGWRGELGLGDDRNRCGPEKVSGKHQFLKVAAGDRHTLAIALKHKSIGRKLRESRPLEAPNAHVGLQRSACCALTKLNYFCVRSSPTSPLYPSPSSPKAFEDKSKPKYCKTCDCLALCPWCARMCHAGHEIVEVDEELALKLPARSTGGPRIGASCMSVDAEPPLSSLYPQLCECGFRGTCKRLQVNSEEEYPEDKAIILQRFGRWIAHQRKRAAFRASVAFSRKYAAKTHVYSKIRQAVWRRADTWREDKVTRMERPRMAEADVEAHAVRKYLKCQIILQACENQVVALRAISAASGVGDPLMPESDVRLRSRRALRQWHRRHYRDERSTLEETALLTKELPSGGDFRVELGLVPDPDVNLFVLSARQRALQEVDKEASQFLRRRASISGPEALYSRVRFTRRDQLRVIDSRRSRDDLYQKHCFEDKSFVYVEPEEEEVVSAMNRKQQLQQEAAEAERAERRARRRKLVDEEEEEEPLNLQDLLPLFVHERPIRSATEAAQDEYDGMQTRESREGVVESLSDAEKWLLSDDLLECEESQRYKQAPTTLQAALATSTSCPHLFHAPEMPKPPIHIRDLLTRDKDVLDRRAYLKEQKLLDFAKLMAPPKPELAPGELTPPPTPRLEPPLYRIKRSLSLAAPERAASTVEMWRRHASYLASMAASPRKYRKGYRDSMHFANLEAPPTWFIKTRPPEFDPTIRRYEIERDALDPDVQNFVEPERLSDDQWIGEKELIEKIAEEANRKNWIESESESEEESVAESTDEETQEASKETVGERLARKEAAKEARKEEKRVAREERRLAKARAKDEERKRLRVEREAKAASSKKKTPKKKKVTLDAEAMRSPPDGPQSPLTPSPKRRGSRSPARPGTASSRPGTSGSRPKTPLMTPRWEQHEDDQGRTYYFCAETGETSWSKPDNWKLQEQEDVLGTPEL